MKGALSEFQSSCSCLLQLKLDSEIWKIYRFSLYFWAWIWASLCNCSIGILFQMLFLGMFLMFICYILPIVFFWDIDDVPSRIKVRD